METMYSIQKPKLLTLYIILEP